MAYPTTTPLVDISVRVDPEQFNRAQKMLSLIPNGGRIACSTAINKTLATARTEISRSVTAAMGGMKTFVDHRVKVKKSTRANLFGWLNIKDKGVNLMGFNPMKNASGIEATIFGKRKMFFGAFFGQGANRGKASATMGPGKAGAWQAFKRTPGAAKRPATMGRYGPNSIFGKFSRGPRKGQPILRQPIETIPGPSAAETFRQTPGLANEAKSHLDANLQKNLNSQIQWLLAKGAPKR
jgi:hypothetical protein